MARNDIDCYGKFTLNLLRKVAINFVKDSWSNLHAASFHNDTVLLVHIELYAHRQTIQQS